MAATVGSSVSLITTASLELLQLLLRCVTPQTASAQSGVFVGLVRRLLDESFMSSENAHSRAGVEIVMTVLRLDVATIAVPLVAVFVKPLRDDERVRCRESVAVHDGGGRRRTARRCCDRAS